MPPKPAAGSTKVRTTCCLVLILTSLLCPGWRDHLHVAFTPEGPWLLRMAVTECLTNLCK